MSDEPPAKRRKRPPMFYKVKYLQDKSKEIPRSTRRRHELVAAATPDLHSTQLQNPTVPSSDSYHRSTEPGSHLLPKTLVPLQPAVNLEVSSNELYSQDRNENMSCDESGSGLSGDQTQVSSSSSVSNEEIGNVTGSVYRGLGRQRRRGSGGGADDGDGGDDDGGGGDDDEGDGGGGPSSPSSSDSSGDESSSSESSSDESTGDDSSSDTISTSSEEEPSIDVCANAKVRADTYRKKYSLDDEITQSQNNKLSKMECLLLLLSFSMRHALDDVAVGDLLKLINDVMGQEVIPDSQWVFNKIFHLNCGADYHFYCLKCEIYVGKHSDLKTEKSVNCPNPLCDQKCNLSSMNEGHFFLSLPLRPQLQCFLENTPRINDLLNYRFSRETSEGKITDVFDGEFYRQLSQQGEVLSNVDNFSLSFSTDGVPIYLSVNNSMWPIQCRINELPPLERFSKNNSFISGIWFGSKSHPNMNVYFSKFCEEARSLFLEGLKWKKPNGEMAISKVVTLQCILDSVAKPDVQCMRLFNAYCACGYCYHPGVLVDLRKDEVVPGQAVDAGMHGNIADIVDEENDGNDGVDDVAADNDVAVDNSEPVDDENVVNEDVDRGATKKVVKQVRYTVSRGGHYKERLDSEIRSDMFSSITQNKTVNGVKGVSPLIVLISFNMVWGFGIDALHCVFLGVTRQLLKLWCESKLGVPFSVRKRMKEIDARLLSFKPPSKKKLRSRLPQTIFKYPKWKGNQLRDWLLIYCIPCLIDILPTKYFSHLTQLVSGVATLYSECISQAELNAAKANLLKFVDEFEVLYGPSQMVYNVHLLTHLAKCVELWGPLWAYSAFTFESNNGVLKSLVSGTRGVVTQIARKYCIYRFLPVTVAPYDITDDISVKCSNLLIPKKKQTGLLNVLNVKLIDLTVDSLFSEEEKQILTSVNVAHGNVSCYNRMICNGIMFHTKTYSRQGKKSDERVVCLNNGNYGLIERILFFEGMVYVILRKIEVDRNAMRDLSAPDTIIPNVNLCHLYPYGTLEVVNASRIVAKSVLMKVPPRTFVASFLNIREGD